jgi:hypothetical protein
MISRDVLIVSVQVRKFGFHGSVDSTDDFIEVFKTAQELKFLPK